MRTAAPSFAHRVAQGVMRSLAGALPSSCALCGCPADAPVCRACDAQYFSHRPARCLRCATSLPHAMKDINSLCGGCLNDPPAFDATIAATEYLPPVDQLVLALKFGGQLALAPAFGQRLHEAWLRAQLEHVPTLLTPVPLGAHRLAERGFNQAQEIARPLARHLGIPLHPRLAVRVRDTTEQARLPPQDRRKNIRNAFTLSPDAIDRIRGAHVGIVDDVMTTGETLNELAAMLKRFGAARVTNFVFARSSH